MFSEVVGVCDTRSKSVADLRTVFVSLLLKVKLFVVFSLCLLCHDVLPEEITHPSSLSELENSFRRVFSKDFVSNNNNNNLGGDGTRNLYFYPPQSSWSHPKERQERNINPNDDDSYANGGRDQVSFVNGVRNGPSLHITTDRGVTDPCSDDAIDKCFENVPILAAPGIPSSLKQVELNCNAFDAGMNCKNDYSHRCLTAEGRKKMQGSVQGAEESYGFLCKDPEFRKQFLQHASCYPKIESLWDRCTNDFMVNIEKADNYPADSKKKCCVRIRYLQCVTELAHLHCGKAAADFLQRMAENLVLERETMKNANKDNSGSEKSEGLPCAAFTFKNCTADKRTSGAVWFPGPSFSNSNNAISLILVSLMSIFFTSYLLCV